MRILHRDQLHQNFFLGFLRADVIDLFNLRRVDLRLRRLDMHRIGLVLRGNLQDRLGHRRGEQDRLALLRQGFDDGFNIFAEAHVQHFVRFIQNQYAALIKAQRPAPDMIEYTARGSDDDVGTFFQFQDLLADLLAAVNGDGADPFFIFGKLADFITDLHRQLAGWG